MNPYQIELKLKQHTPIIHFQHEQQGATIRGSELKPKLDKFLVQEVFNNDFEKFKFFLIGYKSNDAKREKDLKERFSKHGYTALNYKVKVDCSNRNIEEIENRRNNGRWSQYPMFFGNMGVEGTEERKCFVHFQKIKLIINCFDEKLIEYLKKYLPAFFVTHNFGTRQNKGFGSFYIDRSDNLYQDYFDAANQVVPYYLSYAYVNNESRINKFKAIDIIYKLMKGGINFTDRNDNFIYHKGFIFKYFLEQGIGNEKHLTKEVLFPENPITNDELHKKYVRAILGVNESVEYKDNNNGRVGEIKYSHSKIERFKSPLTFKIIDNDLLIIPDKNFDLLNIQEKADEPFILKRNKDLKTTVFLPDKSTFSMEKFLKEFVSYYNVLSEHYHGESVSGKTNYTIEEVDDTLIENYYDGNIRGFFKDILYTLEGELSLI